MDFNRAMEQVKAEDFVEAAHSNGVLYASQQTLDLLGDEGRSKFERAGVRLEVCRYIPTGQFVTAPDMRTF